MTFALINHLWQSTLFSLLAALLAFALRRNRAQVRYWIWLIASLKFLVPFSLIVALGSYLAPSEAMPVAQAGFSEVMQEVNQPFTAPAVSIGKVHPTVNATPLVLFAIWLCGFAIVIFRWCAQWRRIRVAIRPARPLVLPKFSWRTHSCVPRRDSSRRLFRWVRVPILSSPAQIEPGIFGIFHPVLLLPEGIADHLTPAQLEAILVHELCHVRRRDNLFAAMHMLVETIFWFHPLVWWIGARLVEERERACDEEVLRQGNQPHVYAESILKTCQFYLESPLSCMSGVTGSDLKKRIVRIMTQRRTENLGRGRKLLLASFAITALAGPLAFGLIDAPQDRAQSTATESPGTKPKFEVASIKLNKSGANAIGMTRSPGMIAIRDCPLKILIEEAYDLEDYQISGGPHWIDTDKYDVVAKVKGKASFSQKMKMLQPLLADRFQLKMHREVRTMRVYSLVIAKGGPKLRAPTANEHQGLRITDNGFIGHKVSMKQLAWGLTSPLNLPVVDRTGLHGGFDFTLKYVPDDEVLVANSDRPTGPSLFTALREQLGLKLKPGKGPVTVYVIDHVERPSAN